MKLGKKLLSLLFVSLMMLTSMSIVFAEESDTPVEEETKEMSVSYSAQSFKWDGSIHDISSYVTVKDKTSNTTLVNNTDYKITYSSTNNSKVGTYQFYVEGLNDYAGQKSDTYSFEIKEQSVSLSVSKVSLTSATIKFSAISGGNITKYGVEVLNSSNKVVKSIDKASSGSSISISDLTKNTKYTVKVYGYAKDASGNSYSQQIASSSFTTKKTTSITTSKIAAKTAKFKFDSISNNSISKYGYTVKNASGKTVASSSNAKADTTFSLSDLSANTKYTITVTAYTSDTNYTAATASFTTKKTTSITTSSIKAKSAKFKFAKISGNSITKYVVKVTDSSGNTVKTFSSASGDKTYTIDGLKANKKYKITVTAYTSDTNYTVATKSFTTKLSTPSITVKAGNEMAQIKWKKISGAEGYRVYRATSKNGTYKRIKTITKNSTVSYTDYLLTKGKTYYYKVRAYKTVDGSKTYSAYSSIKSVKAKAPTKDTYYLRVNIKTNCTVAYQKGFNGKYKAVKAFATSAGKNGNSKPILGTHRTTAKYRWKYMHANCYTQYATRITGHYLFHSVPYSKQSPSTLWTAEYNKLGSFASAGCIRMNVISSKWIYDHCPVKTKVVVVYSSKDDMAKPTVKKIGSSVKGSKRNWDPSDPSSQNPWNK